jgi:dihydrofolate synthase/folylpolyglutamate synthase
MMDYKDAMTFINESHKFGSRLGLERIRILLEHMGNPQEKLKYVHVAGTNGKGSTVSFISNILIEAGYKVGIYTSPFIHRFTERIKINNLEISEKDIARIADKIKSKLDVMLANGCDHATEFEIVTAMAFQHFFENDCDIVVLEVGLGGRMDSTNIISASEVSVITTINFDHMDVLGDTLPQIAYEKAGIIKENGSVVLYPQDHLIVKLFEAICEKRNAELLKVEFSNLKSNSNTEFGQEFAYKGYSLLKTSLLGSHQTKNAAVAIKAIEVLIDKGYVINEDDISRGIEKAKWPGRLELVNENPMFFVDGAHNVEGTKNLAENLARLFPGKKITFIAGVLSDKEFEGMMEPMIPLAERFITVTPNSLRALKARDLESYLLSRGVDAINGGEVEEAVFAALNLVSEGDVICAFGSLYYIGEVREYFGLI